MSASCWACWGRLSLFWNPSARGAPPLRSCTCYASSAAGLSKNSCMWGCTQLTRTCWTVAAIDMSAAGRWSPRPVALLAEQPACTLHFSHWQCAAACCLLNDRDSEACCILWLHALLLSVMLKQLWEQHGPSSQGQLKLSLATAAIAAATACLLALP
jgi:hypothetical protein